MDRGSQRGGNPGGPGRPASGGSGPARGPAGAGGPPAAPERALPRPPSTLPEISPETVKAVLGAEAPAAPASTPPAPPARNVPPARTAPGSAWSEGTAEKKPAPARSEPPARSSATAPIDEPLPARVQAVRVQVDATGAARSDEPVSLYREITLAAGLIAGLLGAALPALLLGWLVLALVVQTGASEILERTGGLAPTTFGGGYWLSLGVNVGVLLWCAVRRLRGRRVPWRPLVVLILGYVVALWALVSSDACGLVDVPDVLTAFTLLGVDALVQYLLPVALLALLVQAGLYAWRVGRTSARVARRITAVAGCLGLAGLSAAALIVLAGAGGPVAALRAQAGDVRIADPGGVETDRQRYERVAATVDATSARLCP